MRGLNLVLTVVVTGVHCQARTPPGGPSIPPIPPSPGFPPCSVCGDGKHISLPDVIIDVPTQLPMSCGVFELAGLYGFIEEVNCPLIPKFAVPCGCVPSSPVAPVPSSPVAPMTSPRPVSTPLAPIGPVTVPPGGCLVCGDGMVVGSPEASITLPGQPTVNCGLLQQAGLDGLISGYQCKLLPPLIVECNCTMMGELPEMETPQPATVAPLARPPSPGFAPCSVCGHGKRVSLPDVIIDIPTQPPRRCALFELEGLKGFIEEQFCPLVPQFAIPCGCAPIAPSFSIAPIAPVVPETPAPVLLPTVAPIDPPAPVILPTTKVATTPPLPTSPTPSPALVPSQPPIGDVEQSVEEMTMGGTLLGGGEGMGEYGRYDDEESTRTSIMI